MKKIKNFNIGDKAPVPPKPDNQSQIMSNWNIKYTVPLVSIVCATYNHIDTIENALNSFLMQKTNFPFEIIIHDDASTDGTEKIIQKYYEAYPDIIVPILQTENQWSKGIKPIKALFERARGKYIAFCEGDDYWTDPMKLIIQAEYLQEHPETSVCGHNAYVVENGIITKLDKLPKSSRKDFTSKQLIEGAYIATLTTMFVNKLNPIPFEHNHFLNADNLIFSRLGTYGNYKHLENIENGVYTIHDGGAWSTLNKKMRVAEQINTSYWMAQYYSRIDKREVASFYFNKAALQSLANIEDFNFSIFLDTNTYFIKSLMKSKFPIINKLRKLNKS